MVGSILKTIPTFLGAGICDLRIEKLAGLTNDNYLVATEQKKYILRIPRGKTSQFISRINEKFNADIAQKLDIAPKCLWRGEGDQEGMSLSEFVDNAEHLNVKDQNMVDRVTTTLVKLHHSKIIFNGVLDNQAIATRLTKYFDLCSPEQQALLVADYQKSLSLLECEFDTRPKVPSHVDLITENILQQGKKIWFIDWEYSAMASPFWDMAVFCNSAGLNPKQENELLRGILKDYKGSDFKSLKRFCFITKSISECWNSSMS